MGKYRKMAALVLAILLAVIIAAFAALDRIVVFCLTKAYNVDITYAGLKRSSIADFELTDLTCVDRERGFGFYSERAGIKTDIRGMTVDFSLHEVHFIKRAAESAASFDSLSALVSAPFTSSWQYYQMSGSVRPIADGLEVRSFTADGDDVKVELKGDVRRSGLINFHIVIYFSGKLSEKIPSELSPALLQSEPGGWKSLAVELSGDYKRPAIQVKSRLFRLSVKEISISE